MNNQRNVEPEEVVFLEDADPGDVAADTDERVEGSESEQVSALREELNRYREQYLRKLADFENYRRRQEREMAEFRRVSHADLVKECLPVLDNLERALDMTDEGTEGFRAGVELILRQLRDVLGRFGLQEVDPKAEPFDPTFHEAVQRQEVPGLPEPTVVQVLVKGYQLYERLLRPAMVVVGVPPMDSGSIGSTSEAGHEQDHRD